MEHDETKQRRAQRDLCCAIFARSSCAARRLYPYQSVYGWVFLAGAARLRRIGRRPVLRHQRLHHDGRHGAPPHAPRRFPAAPGHPHRAALLADHAGDPRGRPFVALGHAAQYDHLRACGAVAAVHPAFQSARGLLRALLQARLDAELRGLFLSGVRGSAGARLARSAARGSDGDLPRLDGVLSRRAAHQSSAAYDGQSDHSRISDRRRDRRPSTCAAMCRRSAPAPARRCSSAASSSCRFCSTRGISSASRPRASAPPR